MISNSLSPEKTIINNNTTNNNNFIPQPVFLLSKPSLIICKTIGSLRCPETPGKPKIIKGKAKEIYDRFTELKEGKLKYNGKEYAVKIMEGAIGEYKQAFQVIDTQNIFDHIQNEDIIVKTYHPLCVWKSSTKLEKFMKCAINHYELLNKLQLNVAEILNIETAMEDNFFLVKKIPYSVNLSSWGPNAENKYKQFEELEKIDKVILEQAKHFFNVSIQNQTEIDLLPDNLRYDGEEKLHLIDLPDDKVVIHQLDDLAVEIHQKIKQWANGNSSIFDYLTQDFESINPKFSKNFKICEQHSLSIKNFEPKILMHFNPSLL
jgi:hypothetical protein